MKKKIVGGFHITKDAGIFLVKNEKTLDYALGAPCIINT